MSSKLFRQLLEQGSALDKIKDSEESRKVEAEKRRIKELHENIQKEEEKTPLQSQIESMLFFDKAFSEKGAGVKASLTRRQKDEKKKKRAIKKGKTLLNATVGNSRSSSSSNATRARVNVPTFNKRRYQKEKKIKDLAHLAKMLGKK